MPSSAGAPAIVLGYPLSGRFRARNSPARRVPSHGTDLMGTTYAIDLVPVDAAGRSAPATWRTLLASEAPDRFVGFGVPVLAPLDGEIVAVHDGEVDHAARRSPLTGILYLLGQARRLRAGAGAVAGNHVVIAPGVDGPFVLIAHLRAGSIRVRPGMEVRRGDPIGQCGNSGNSTQPHVHLQATDSIDWPHVRGLPIAFEGPGGPRLPDENEIIEV